MSAGPLPRRWWVWPRPGGVTLRARVTATAAVAITAAVVVGVLFMYLLQMHSIRRTIDGELRTYAAQIVQSAPTGAWPRPLPSSTLDANAEAQVLAPDGTVLAASKALAGLPAVYALPAGSDVPVRQKAADGVIPGEIRVIALRTTVAGHPVVILTGTSTDLLRQVDSEFLRHLALGLPIILFLAAVAVWLVVGRALRPVEKIRHAVTDITSVDLSRRVPDPGTSDEIGNLARTMNDMLDRLDDAASRQRRFVADASHELRSPLAAIRTTLEVGLAHPEQAPWPVIAARAAQQSSRLEELIHQLLVLAKADDRQLSGARKRVELEPLLRELTAGASAPGVHVDLQIAPCVVTVGNPDQLGRLFRNVIDNAVRYARAAVRVTATAADEVQIVIDDDGPGIPSADRERIFDRFVRLDQSRERGSGTAGLGLAIAREIAQAHRGRIGVSEGPDGGTRVTITLPAETDGPPASAAGGSADAR
ncbi:HAMP domain-containing histidine kinase [Frankia sp. AgB1.9]|uniref:sensor histidine kinase n=1 Tax=unclassified Frankia TaxID=2632575 RepID=UPI001931E050|nr:MULTISPECIES: HAMP domain-containing sensor histidine kinase [unclassified Frankia]MBL7490532.1 HAMP domain-containing histidine kinase [Frankia sp. AgW1.1]MBL7551001.1 HAMP domain-containing histidine kinase [Frankia sp. AgB1.9]MBL7621218.1 HAMP domain-containing histidine kinase [Frankia sp. AgB1.8]